MDDQMREFQRIRRRVEELLPNASDWELDHVTYAVVDPLEDYPSVQGLAQELEISVAALRGRLRYRYDTSPGRVLRALRVDRFSFWLQEGESMQAAAIKAGFSGKDAALGAARRVGESLTTEEA